MRLASALALVLLLVPRAVPAEPLWPDNYLLGSITGHRTLSSGYPGPSYFVAGDLTVSAGAELTIEPGCRLVFAASDTTHSGQMSMQVELSVYGTLRAVGTATDSIWFVGDIGAWPGVQVFAGGSANLAYCSLDDVRTGLEVRSGGTGTIRHSLVRNCAGGVTGPARVESCVLLGWSRSRYGTYGTYGATVVDSNSTEPTVIGWFWCGVAQGEARNVIAMNCTDGFQSCTATNCTAFDNSSAGFNACTARDCISAGELWLSTYGFFDCAVSHSDSWHHQTDYEDCSDLSATSNLDPLFVNAPADLRLRPESPFLHWSESGGEIGAYGHDAGQPVPARATTWGRVKALYR